MLLIQQEEQHSNRMSGFILINTMSTTQQLDVAALGTNTSGLNNTAIGQ
jgi:hypothetical protein